MPCPRTHHLNNVPRLRGEKHDISLKILHKAGFETARQAVSDTGSGIELKSDQENNVRIVCCQDRKSPTSKTLLPYIMHTLIFMC